MVCSSVLAAREDAQRRQQLLYRLNQLVGAVQPGALIDRLSLIRHVWLLIGRAALVSASSIHPRVDVSCSSMRIISCLCFPGARVEPFGSSASGLALRTSDLDLGIFGVPDSTRIARLSAEFPSAPR